MAPAQRVRAPHTHLLRCASSAYRPGYALVGAPCIWTRGARTRLDQFFSTLLDRRRRDMKFVWS
jgi:hypothetical protein